MRSFVPVMIGFLLVAGVAWSSPDEKGGGAGSRLHSLFGEHWELWMKRSPTWASSLGDRRYNRLWADRSFAAIARNAREDEQVLERLLAISRDELSPADRINRDLFERRLRDDIEEHGFRFYLIPLNQRGGLQTLHETAENLRFDTVQDYEDWLARLQAITVVVGQTIDLMKEGIENGIVHPRVIMERIPGQLEHQLVDAAEESPFYKPFNDLPDSIDAPEAKRIRADARRTIEEVVLPAYRRFATFFEQHYLPNARSTVGVSAMPRGGALYAFRVRKYTTTDLTAREVHDIGLAEVARIRGQMLEIMKSVKFEGNFPEFLEFLRSDSQFYFDSPERLLERYQAVSKRADPELVKLFGRLPRMPYGVKAIPDELAPDTTTAYYGSPAPDGSRAGTFWVNLYMPSVRPIYEIEALTLHEAVPGHHLQIALAQELGDLPKFRRFSGYTAFTEGWGLYAESLGDEMGFYTDPYSKFGQLTYEMWRAVRLVVDTGIHVFGWERQRAIDYFKANAAKAEHDIINEIDRYIAWPGQALAYKIGELRIQELRRRATAALGDRFDLRAFHDVVLGSGAVPLDVLEANVDAHIANAADHRELD